MTIQTNYTIANLAALKALTADQRTDSYARLVKSAAAGLPAWYVFIAAITAAPDGNLYVLPDDNPASGRWVRSSTAVGQQGPAGSVNSSSGALILDNNTTPQSLTTGQMAILNSDGQLILQDETNQLTEIGDRTVPATLFLISALS